MGPDLENVTVMRDREWLARFILEPDVVIAEEDPLVTQLLEEYNMIPMPNSGLTEAEVEAVLSYLDAVSGIQPEPEQPEEPQEEQLETPKEEEPEPSKQEEPETIGNPLLGKLLFTGETTLQNGGPPCLGCHSVAGITAFGGGALGPDLTEIITRYGEAGLASVLASLPFPTMKPIYENNPLTEEEQIHIKAYFETAVNKQPVQNTAEFGLLAIIGFAVALLLAQVLWRRRLTTVRQPLLKQESKKETI